MSQASAEFIPTRIAILTVSSRRGEEDDTSGHWLREAAQEAGHQVVEKAIVKENRYAIRAQVSAWIASDNVQVVLITGGTGFTDGDQAPEALLPLFDREVEGFGEVLHAVVRRDRHLDAAVPGRGRRRQPHADFRHAGLNQSLPYGVGQHHRPAA